jgi:recombination protein RecR
MKIPDSIKPFVNEFSKLPGIGPRQAIRLAFHLANRKKAASDIMAALGTIQGLKLCPACFSTHDNEGEFCAICEDRARDKNTVAIVEKETDLISIESTQKYNGVYLCLGDIKKAGKLDESQKIKLDSLKARGVSSPSGKLTEIIIAFSPTTAGDISAEIIAEHLRGSAEKITRLGRGIPIGGEVEFADPDTLFEAIEGRK